jgi:hypothetical protein
MIWRRVELRAVERKKSVLLVGIDPVMINFSSADFAPYNLSADLVMSALLAVNKRLSDLGYEADLCLTDLGETAERVVEDKLKAKAYDCVSPWERSSRARQPPLPGPYLGSSNRK